MCHSKQLCCVQCTQETIVQETMYIENSEEAIPGRHRYLAKTLLVDNKKAIKKTAMGNGLIMFKKCIQWKGLPVF